MISKWFSHLKLFAFTGMSQVFVQALGFCCGIAIIRLLPSEEYALFTLVNTMASTMMMLADGGIGNGVMFQGGQVWQDRSRLGAVLVTGLNMRKQLATFSLLVSMPALIWLLRNQGTSWAKSMLLTLSVLPMFWITLSTTLLEIVPKLRQDIVSLQNIHMLSNSVRLLSTFVFVTIFPLASIAVLCTGIAQAFGNWRLRRLSSQSVDLNQVENPEVRQKTWKVVQRTLPGSIYYCLSGQITIWLISVFGSTGAIAELGALGRLAMVLNIFAVLYGSLVVPRFARISEDKKKIPSTFFTIQLGLIIFSAIFIGSVWFFPSESLWILGEKYSQLTEEVVLMAAGSSILLMANGTSSLNNARGYLPVWYFNPVIGTIALVMFISMINTSTTGGVLMLNIYLGATSQLFSIGVFLFYHRIIKHESN